MREHRNLSEEELALLSAPVEKPTAQWDSYQETGTLRPLESRGVNPREEIPVLEPRLSGFLDKVETGVELPVEPRESAFQRYFAPWKEEEKVFPEAISGLEPVARTLWNIPGGAARGVAGFFSAISPFHIGKELGRRAVIASFADKAAGDDDRLYHYYRDFLTEYTESQLTETQQFIAGATAELVGPFAEATFANPYDPANAALFDPEKTAERTPLLLSAGEDFESHFPYTPWDQEYNPEWSSNVSRLVQEDLGEFVFEVAVGRGARLAQMGSGARRFTPEGRLVGGIRQEVSDVRRHMRFQRAVDEGDALSLMDIYYQQRRSAGTVELDIARQQVFARGGMGGVVADPETGRTYISTAAHVVLGKRGEPVDFQGIRARTGTGEIGTVQRVSAVDLERDIALLEVAGLSETLDIPDLPDPSAPHTLLGREGIRAESRVVGESGAYLETTTATGVAGESGAPIISGGADIAGAYLGTLDQPGRVERGMYAPADAISQLFGQVGDRGVQLGHELSQRALREGLHHRIRRGDPGAFIEDVSLRRLAEEAQSSIILPELILPSQELIIPGEVAFSGAVAESTQDPKGLILPGDPTFSSTFQRPPKSVLHSADFELHSRDPEAELSLYESDWHRRYRLGVSREILPSLSPDDPLHEIYRKVSGHRNLFFRLGVRGEDVTQLRTLDLEQTLEYEAWYHSRGAPIDVMLGGLGGVRQIEVIEHPFESFSFEGGASSILSRGYDPEPASLIESAGVMGMADITTLGQYLKATEGGRGQLEVQLFGPQGARTVGVEPTGDVLQVLTGRSPAAPLEGRDPSIHLPGHQFVYEPQVLMELDIPEVDELRRIYRDVAETDPARGFLWLPDPNVDYEYDIPPTLISAEAYQRTPDPDGGVARLALVRSVGGRTQTESVLVHRAGQKPVSEMPPMEEWTIGELTRAAETKAGRYKQEAIVEIERRGGVDRDRNSARSRWYKMPPMEEWTSIELNREVAQSLDKSGEAYDEIFRRRFESAAKVGGSIGRALRAELRREYRLGRPQAKEIDFETDVAFRQQAGDIQDETRGLGPQGYKEEMWEPLEGTTDPDADDTGKIYEGWTDVYGDFDQVGKSDVEIEDLSSVGAEDKEYIREVLTEDPAMASQVIATPTEYIDEIGSVDPGSEIPIGSEKIAVEGAAVGGSGISPEVWEKIDDMFSGYIERREYEQKLLTEGDPELQASILQQMDERDPDWRRKMRVAVRRDRSFQTPQLKPYWEQAVEAQAPGWQQQAQEFWYAGQFEEYYHHVEPVRLQAYQRYRQYPDADYRKQMRTRLIREGMTPSDADLFLRASEPVPEPAYRAQLQVDRFFTGKELGSGFLTHARVRELEGMGIEFRDLEVEIAEVDPRMGARLTKSRLWQIEDIIGEQRQMAPLEMRQAEAARLAAPRPSAMDIFRERIFLEEADVDPKYRTGWTEDRWFHPGELSDQRIEDVLWHQRDVAEERLHLKTLAGVEAVGPEAWSHLSVDRPRDLTERQQRSADRLATERQQLADAEAEERRIAQSGAYRMQEDEAYQVFYGAWMKFLKKEDRDASIKMLEGMGRHDEAERLKANPIVFEPIERGIIQQYRSSFREDRVVPVDELDRLRKERAKDISGKYPRTKLHSLPWEEVHPLDLETPRARLAGFFGIESDRTYGLELELITDLTRAEMERELEWQMAQGLALKYDLSLRTARSEVAIEHHPPVDVQFSQMHLPGEIQRVESAEYQRYRATYTGAPGYERVRPEDFDTRYAHELVFPVMQGESGLELIDSTLRRLREFETELNTSMGMHIHVGAQDLSNYDLVGLWGAFARREPVIDLMHEPSRRGEGSTYAQSLLTSQGGGETLGELLRTAMREGDPSYLQSVPELERTRSRLEFARKTSLLSGAPRETFLDQVRYGDRYQKLNLRTPQYRTIEYRQPAPTLDITEVEQHIGFITSFVDEFAGKPLEWAFSRDPRLQQEHAGLDLTFERPDETGQLLLLPEMTRTQLHSRDVTSDYIWRFLSPEDRRRRGLDRAAFGALPLRESVDYLREQYPGAETLSGLIQRADIATDVFFRAQPGGTDLLGHRSYDLALTKRYREHAFLPRSLRGTDVRVDWREGEPFVTHGGVFASAEFSEAERYLLGVQASMGDDLLTEGGNELRIFEGHELPRHRVLETEESIVQPIAEFYRVDREMFPSSGRFFAGGEWWQGEPNLGFQDAPAELFAVDPLRRYLQEERPIGVELHSADELTPSQQRAMQHTTGHAAVMAGPGSGKSRTLIERLRYLSEEGIATSDDVLTLVFGKKAQLELKDRAAELGGDWNISTVDAFARSIVRENFGELGYTRAPDITESSFQGWLSQKGRLEGYGVSELSGNIPEEWAHLYEETRRGFTTGREDYSALPDPLQQAIHDFRLEKFQAGKMDFTDAISQAGYLLESNEAVRQRYQERFKFLQVDEFQDVSPIQGRLIQNLAQNIWAVGDLDQSIMSFRGGTGSVMRELIEGGASVYNIEENFRSTPEIVRAAQGFIQSNLGRMEMSQQAVKPSGEPVGMVGVTPLTTEQQAISRIAEQIREGEETAILTRTHREREVIEHELSVELRQRGWEESQIKDLLSFETLHASKGREWQNVILPINLLESDFGNRQRLFTLPSPYARTAVDFAEEERLFYVGMTRAQERLTVMGDPQHPYYEQVSRAISGADEVSVPSYLGDPPELTVRTPRTKRGLFGGLIERVGEALDRYLHGDPLQRAGRIERQRTEMERRRQRRNKTDLHSADLDMDPQNLFTVLADRQDWAFAQGFWGSLSVRGTGFLEGTEGSIWTARHVVDREKVGETTPLYLFRGSTLHETYRDYDLAVEDTPGLTLREFIDEQEQIAGDQLLFDATLSQGVEGLDAYRFLVDELSGEEGFSFDRRTGYKFPKGTSVVAPYMTGSLREGIVANFFDREGGYWHIDQSDFSLRSRRRWDAFAIYSTLDIEPGMSGSPLIDPDRGTVLGVNIARVDQGPGVTARSDQFPSRLGQVALHSRDLDDILRPFGEVQDRIGELGYFYRSVNRAEDTLTHTSYAGSLFFDISGELLDLEDTRGTPDFSQRLRAFESNLPEGAFLQFKEAEMPFEREYFPYWRGVYGTREFSAQSRYFLPEDRKGAGGSELRILDADILRSPADNWMLEDEYLLRPRRVVGSLSFGDFQSSTVDLFSESGRDTLVDVSGIRQAIDLHSRDVDRGSYREGYEIPGLERFLEAADRHSGIFYRFESDEPSTYVSQDLAQTHAILREHKGQEVLLPDSFMVPGMGKYDTLIRPAGRDHWSLYNQQYERIHRGEKEGTWELYTDEYDPKTDGWESVYSGPVDVGYVGRRGLYGHTDRSSFVEVRPETAGFRASERPLQLSDTERHFSVHFGTSTPFQQYVGAMSPGEDVFLSHGVLARLPVNLDALGSIAQQRYAVNPKYDEFIETGNINLNWLADAIGELPEGANPDRIWGDYLSAQQGSDILGLQWAAQRARERLKQRYRQSRFELHSLDDSDDVDRLNAELRELAEDEQIFFDQNFVFNSEDAGEAPREPNPEILFGPDPAADPIPESVPDLLFESELEAFASDISAGHEQAMSFQRGRGLGLGQRISRGFSEAVGERAWGGVLSQIQLVTQDAAVMHTVASLAWEGTRVALGDTLNFGSLIHAGASSMVALGMKAADARLGYRGVLPESRIDLEELGVAVENVPAEAGKHLQRIFSDAGAGTFRWGRGSLSRELERYDPEALVSMFGESGADYLQEFAYQTRRFGQRSHQTQRSLRQGLFDFVTGSIPRSRRYVYDPETREVDVRTGRRGRLDQLLEAGEGRFGGLGLWDASLGAWHQRREYARSGLDVIPDETGDEGIRRSLGVWFAKQAMEYDDDASFFFAKASLAMYPTERKRGRLSSVLDRVFGPLQGEDATPHGLYMTLPIARGLGRMWGRFHAAKPFEQQGLRVDLENLDHVVRRWGAPEWADRIAQRKEHRRERENIFEERRTAPELYQWQDPEHFFSEITGMLGVDVPDFDGFAAQRLGSPYSRFGRHFSRLPKGAKYPLIGGGVGVGGKLLYETFFGEDEPEELVLQDPVGYSVSPRYPVLGALQRTRPYRRLRARAENLLDDVYGEDSFHSEMLKSMVLGKKRNLPEETKGTFLQTGQVHVLTQSGMHVSMFSNILSRYPLLAAPAIFLAAKDAISPPNETVVEPSQSILDRYRLKDSPWTPRWNPPVWDSRFDPYSTEYDPDWKPPAWAWWDTSKYSPLSRGYRGRSERPQPPGMLRAEFSGVQDVLPWTMYSMFGVLPESVYAFRQQSQQQQRVEDVVRAREEFQPVVTETPSLLNLNRATVSDLDALPGISKFYAERIIEHREDLGGFERVEDLLDVRGIGEKTFEQIRPLVNLGAVEKQVTDPEEGYSIDGFEFDVQESPFPGFNPWLDPHPEGSLKNEGIRQLSAELDGEKKGIFSRLWSVLGGEPERDLSLRVELPPIPKQHWQFLGAASFDEKRVGDLYESLSPGDIDPIPVDLARSVVKLKSVGESGKGGWGTGFFVDENIVATNYHMLAPMLTERDGEKGYWTGGSSIFVPGEDGPQEYSVGSVLGVSQSDDVALLRVDSVEGITPLELGSQGVSVTPTRRGFAAEDNTILRTMGYPSGVGEAPQLDVGRIGRKERDMDTPYAYTLADFFLDDIYAFGGESGSPIFGPDDKVYGILFGGIDTDEGIGAERTVVGTHSSDIQKLLDRVLRSPRSSQSVVDDFSTYEEVGWDSFDETLYKMGQLTSRRMQPLSEEFSATWDFQHGLPGIGSNLFVGAGYGIGEGLRGESQLQDNDVASLLRYPANSVVNQGERHPAYQSVVNIEMQSQWLDWLDPPPMGSGTGFFIDEGVIATNYHVATVLADDESEPNYRPGFRISEGHVNVPGFDDPLAIQAVLAADPENDLALLAVEHPEGVKPLRLSDRSPEHFDRITTLGYPGGEGRLPQRDVGQYREPVWTELEDTPIARLFDFYVSGMQAFGGESGSPFLDDQGNVVGVLFSGGSEIPMFEQRRHLDIFTAGRAYAAGADVSDLRSLYEGYLASGMRDPRVKDGFQSASDVYYASPMHSEVNLEEHPVGPNYKRHVQGHWDFQHGLPGIGVNQYVGVGVGLGEGWQPAGGTDVDVVREAMRSIRKDPERILDQLGDRDVFLDEGYIYRLRNLETDQAYVGLSGSHPFSQGGRIRKHLSGTGSEAIAKALETYDPSDFSAEIWKIDDIWYRELGALEQRMIAESSGFIGGYNRTPGGEIMISSLRKGFGPSVQRPLSAVPDVSYDAFENARVGLELPSEFFEDPEYFSLDEASQLRQFVRARLAREPVSNDRPFQLRGVFLQDVLPEREYKPFIPHESRIDITDSTSRLLDEVPGISKGLAERVEKFQEEFGAFETLDTLNMFRGVSDRDLAALRRYFKPVGFSGEGEAFAGVSPVIQQADQLYQLDVDTATVEDFQALRGIGEALAKRIVEDRQARGAFGNIEGLARVRGVSDKLIEALQQGFESTIPSLFQRTLYPTADQSGLLPNVTPRHLGSPGLQAFWGAEGIERLYAYNVENIPSFARSERIRALGEVAIQAPLEAYHETWQPIDPNSARWEDFTALPSVGEVTAKRIVAHREQYGPFGDYRDLSRVEGISRSQVARWSQYFEGFQRLRDFGVPDLQQLPVDDTVLDFEIGSQTPWDIDINRATLEDWMKVPGVSRQMGHRILMHQAGGGDFADIQDLDRRVDLPDAVYQRLLSRLRVDLNVSSAKELGFLPGIGEEIAERIVAHREVYGEFESLEDLSSVEGVSENLLEGLRPYRRETVRKRSQTFERVLEPYPSDMRSHIPFYADEDSKGRPTIDRRDRFPLYSTESTEDPMQWWLMDWVAIPEPGRLSADDVFWKSLREQVPGDVWRTAKNELALLPSEVFRGYYRRYEVNEEIALRVADLKEQRSQIYHEIESDRFLTVGQKRDYLESVEARFGERQNQLLSRRITHQDVFKQVGETALGSIMDTAIQSVGDSVLDYAGAKLFGSRSGVVSGSGQVAGGGGSGFTSQVTSSFADLFPAGYGPAVAPVALAVGTFYYGEKSLDAGYKEVVQSERERVESFHERYQPGQPAQAPTSKVEKMPEGFKIQDHLSDTVLRFIDRRLQEIGRRGMSSFGS